jgi:hypothetical protein
VCCIPVNYFSSICRHLIFLIAHNVYCMVRCGFDKDTISV